MIIDYLLIMIDHRLSFVCMCDINCFFIAVTFTVTTMNHLTTSVAQKLLQNPDVIQLDI